MVFPRIPPPIFVARLFGIPLLLDWSWLPVIPLYSWAIATVYLPSAAKGLSPAACWALGVATTFLLVVSIVTHELAHALVARAEGVRIRDITLYLFGGMARMEGEPPTPAAEFKIAAVGPGASFALGFLFLGLDTLVFHGTHYVGAGRVLYHLGIVNLVLAMFNLLPGYPLDGGRVLRAALWKRRGDAASATRTANTWGRAIAFSLIGVGLYYVRYSDWMTGLWAISIGGVLLTLLGMNERSASRPARVAAAGRSVEEVMHRPPVSVSPAMSVDDVISTTLPAHRQAHFVVAHEGRLHGMLSLADLRELPRERWTTTTVGSRMQPVDDSLFVTVSTPLADALRQLRENGLGHAAVIDADGLVVGNLDLAELRGAGLV